MKTIKHSVTIVLQTPDVCVLKYVTHPSNITQEDQSRGNWQITVI